MTQLVREPTRANTLDLLLTNQPEQALRVDILPGISDHENVIAVRDIRQTRQAYTENPADTSIKQTGERL